MQDGHVENGDGIFVATRFEFEGPRPGERAASGSGQPERLEMIRRELKDMSPM